jgi:hypothetical protein
MIPHSSTTRLRTHRKRYADGREVVATVGSHQIQPVSRIYAISPALVLGAGDPPNPSDMAHQSDCTTLVHRALIDTGAEASTTHIKWLLHKFETIAFEKYMADAGDTRHLSLGYGYLKVVSNDDNGNPNRFSLVHCWYTPTLHHTVFSPGTTV